MTTITWTHEDDEGEEVEHVLPAKWDICAECRGDGKSSAYLGAITQEDREQNWSPEEFEDYMAGGYDRPCEAAGCENGKVKVVDWEGLEKRDPALAKLYEEHLESEANLRAIERAERRMGA